ncbi:toll/interleukin-1 receptor domain-containing protein [Stygiobacter electus]|uniref:Toll/interleukin-1 receptor domain-containing protein n=1 Tax=Stygiobacter electus TaxID=3032292 RepID=A0AAE3TD55_9BACT|nr:toll/interleukin-1 receptor domain-containing protein [Stygiobacter electus]MDF1612615.1 toll/interleukin-1 receptor domain-containing protein [Stygiobacter electus]
MAVSVFISYSHKDEVHRIQLENHLSLLKREKIIETWHDRKILASMDFKNEIDSHLESSTIILFLISSDFIASDYCYEIEMQKAIQQHKANVSLIIPIVLRPCDWQSLEISKFQGLPKDVKPITTWDNIDEAWLDVVKGLRLLIKEFVNNKAETTSEKNSYNNCIVPEFNEWLLDTGIKFQHRFKEKVLLPDLFIYPDIREVSDDLNLFDNIISASSLTKKINHNCIIGDEQIGKTSLCKMYFFDLYNSGFHPILLKGKTINSANLDDILDKAVKEEYYCDCKDDVINGNSVIIIDDFDKVKLNKKYRTKLVENITNRFDKVILTVSSTFRIELFDADYLKNFRVDELLTFGNARRLEIIQKWISLGQEETIDEEYLFRQTDLTKLHIDTFVRKNIVPSKPVFILSILQVLESFTPNNLELTSYGHCYEYLIVTFLKKININVKEIGTYVNYLTELAFFLFQSKSQFIAHKELDEFRRNYSEKYLTINHQVIISNLEKSGIIIQTDKGYGFNYRYIYYFYVAKYLSDHYIEDKIVQGIFSNLVANLHKEENANIIIFLTHHTKNPDILATLQLEMMSVLEKQAEATLMNDELKFLSDFIQSIPKLIIEHKDPQEERIVNQKNIDAIEYIENGNEDQEDELTENEAYRIINKTFKSIEIIGQIIRNRHSSLPKTTLYEITDNSYGIGLRFLKFFLDLSDKFKLEIIEYIKDIFIKHPKVSDEQVEKDARNTFLFLTYGMIFSVLKKISLSLGSTEAKEVYDKIESIRNTPATILINVSIDLLFGKDINVDALAKKYELLEGNIVAQRLFKESVIQHIYMYQAPYDKKQQIAAKFNIPMKSQLLIDNNKDSKIF